VRWRGAEGRCKEEMAAAVGSDAKRGNCRVCPFERAAGIRCRGEGEGDWDMWTYALGVCASSSLSLLSSGLDLYGMEESGAWTYQRDTSSMIALARIYAFLDSSNSCVRHRSQSSAQ
jgi:hypothetical protein